MQSSSRLRPSAEGDLLMRGLARNGPVCLAGTCPEPARAVEIWAQAQPPGMEFFDAETGRRKVPLECLTVDRD